MTPELREMLDAVRNHRGALRITDPRGFAEKLEEAIESALSDPARVSSPEEGKADGSAPPCSSCLRLISERDEARQARDEAEAALAETADMLTAVVEDTPFHDGRYVHGLTCNASRSKPVGNDMCSCAIGRRIKQAESSVSRLTAERDALKAQVLSLFDARQEAIAEVSRLTAQLQEAQQERDRAQREVVSFDRALTATTERAEAAESSLTALREARAWQPIETFVDEGVEVLLYGMRKFSIGIAPGTWNRGDMMVMPHWMSDIRQPTHWMPLPSPPSQEQPDDETYEDLARSGGPVFDCPPQPAPTDPKGE